MLFKKKLISNFIWILAMIVLIVMGAQYAFLYGIDFLFSGDDSILAQWTQASYSSLDIGLVIWIVLFMGVCVAVYYAGRAISGLIRRKYRGKPHIGNIIRILLTCLTILTAILLRGIMLLSSGTVVLKDMTYFNAATALLDGTGDITDLAVHGASRAYIQILYFMMTFLGDRAIAAVLLQVVIQIVTIALVFVTFKSFVSFPCALTASFILAVSPLYTSKLFTADPGCFVGLTAVAAMYLITCLLRNDGGILKTVLGAVFGLVSGYLLFLDATAVIFLVPWLFALVYEALDKTRHKYLAAYLLMPAFTIIGFLVSCFVAGSMDGNGMGAVLGDWLSVTSSGFIPEYALLDNSMGLSGVLQCMILVGIASMTVIGTPGREYIEYDLPWILMMACALTPMTKWGYLRDNSVSLIVYLMLVGSGISAMVTAKIKGVLTLENKPAPAQTEADSEDAASPADAPMSMFDMIRQQENELKNAAAASQTSQSADDGIEFVPVSDEQEDDIAYEDRNKTDRKTDLPKTSGYEDTPVEELPTCIPWASIKALDDDVPEILEPEDEDEEYREETYETQGGEVPAQEESSYPETASAPEATSAPETTPLTEAAYAFGTRPVPEATYAPETTPVPEATYIPGMTPVPGVTPAYGSSPVREAGNGPAAFYGDEDDSDEYDEVSYAQVTGNPDDEGSVEAAWDERPVQYPEPAGNHAVEHDPETVQVDYLPGMIPNPLPLPPKRRHVEMDYDRDFDDDVLPDFEDLKEEETDEFEYFDGREDNDMRFADGESGFEDPDFEGEFDDLEYPQDTDEFNDSDVTDGYGFGDDEDFDDNDGFGDDEDFDDNDGFGDDEDFDDNDGFAGDEGFYDSDGFDDEEDFNDEDLFDDDMEFEDDDLF